MTIDEIMYFLTFLILLFVSVCFTYLIFRFIIRPALGLDRIEKLLEEMNAKKGKKKKS